MLQLSSSALRRAPAPDGFAWWYCDLVDAQGQGLVLIWSLGLPFLPRREGDGGDAAARPALSLCTYRDGQEHFYLLDAPRPGDVEWSVDRGRFRFGASTLSVDVEAGRARFRADIDAPLPGGDRVRGTIALAGPRAAVPDDGDGGCLHAWSPIATACEASAHLDVGGGDAFVAEGRGYLDGNRSDAPLDALGIDEWRWGRIAFPSREVVYYHLKGSDGRVRLVVLEVSREGKVVRTEDGSAAFAEGLPTLYGLRRASTLLLRGPSGALRVEYGALVDDGPFYQRYLVRATDARGEVGLGTAERVIPRRVDVPWQRPFIEMRVQRQGEPGSRFLPLFAGSRRGRWSRLLSSLAERAGAA